MMFETYRVWRLKHILKEYSSDVVLKKKIETEAAEAEISWLFVPPISHTPKIQIPTFPIMQADSIFY